jgi:hypothetical protein
LDAFYVVVDPDGSLKKSHDLAVEQLGVEIEVEQPDAIVERAPAHGMTPICVESHCIVAWSYCRELACSYSFGWLEPDGKITPRHFRIIGKSAAAFRAGTNVVYVPMIGPGKGPMIPVSRIMRDAALSPTCSHDMQSLEPTCIRPKFGE